MATLLRWWSRSSVVGDRRRDSGRATPGCQGPGWDPAPSAGRT